MKKPWDMSKREETVQKLKEECDRVRDELGASHIVMIAFFSDGKYLHMIDGGHYPSDSIELYERLAKVHRMQRGSPDKDVGYIT